MAHKYQTSKFHSKTPIATRIIELYFYIFFDKPCNIVSKVSFYVISATTYRLASGSEETSLEAVIGLLQKMSSRNQGEVRKLLDSFIPQDIDDEMEDIKTKE